MICEYHYGGHMKYIRGSERKWIFIAGVCLFSVLIVLLATRTPLYTTSMRQPDALDEGWNVEKNEESLRIIYSRQITDELAGKTINFYAYDAFVTAYLNDKEVYHYGEATRFCKSPASAEHFVILPSDSAGQELRIVIDSVYKSKYIDDYEFIYGEYGELVNSIINDEIGDIILNAVMLGLAFILFILFLSEYKHKIVETRALYLGFIGLFLVLGSNCDLYLFQMLLPYGQPQYFVYYFVMLALPGILISYLEALPEKGNLTVSYYVHIGVVTVFTILHFTGVAEYTESLAAYCMIAGVEVLVAMVIVIRQGIKQRHGLQIGLYLLIGFALLNAIIYVLDSEHGGSLTLTKIGVCLYMCIGISEYISNLVYEMLTIKNAELLKKQAYTDHLTGLGNRYAFAEAVSGADLRKLSLVSFDLNNLKYYNDRYGHMYGDRLISATAKILSQVFGDVYRTGGDEFIAVLKDTSEVKLEEMKKKMCDMALKQSNTDLIIEIACGYSSYTEDDLSYEEIMRRADENMYRHKAELKAFSGVESMR